MKFLLTAVNAKYIHSNPALYSLRAYAADYAEHVEIAEYTINNQTGEILSDIYARKPDVIGFSCYIWNITQIMDIVTELHKLMPELPIWLGGPEVSFDAGKRLQESEALAGIMVGEGEATFLELLQFYVDNSVKLEQIGGIVYREENGSIVVHDVRPLTDLTSLPFLYDDLDQFANKIIYYETSRGCPFRCSYCLSSIDKSVRLRDLSVVKKELQFFLDHRVSQVKFIDRTFNCNHEHAMEIWKYILEHDNGITNFHFEIAADLLREDELALLNQLRPGAVQMEIGVQTTNETTIREIRRVMDIAHLEQIVARLHQGQNIHIHLDLIAGLPFEDYESFGSSFDRVYAMKPEQLQLGFLKVLKGSYMMEKAQDYGIGYTSKPPYEVLYTKWLSYTDVCRLKEVEEMVEIYYNSNQFSSVLPYLQRFFKSPFVFFEELADFYKNKGYFINTPSRSYRYEVLLQFAEQIKTENACADMELVKELLTLDIYLRENAKSRPSFAADCGEYKEEVNAFFQKEASLRESGEELLPQYDAYEPRQLVRMLHVEQFHYEMPVLSERKEHYAKSLYAKNIYAKREKPEYLLFDYQNRNPLTYEARVFHIELEG